MNQSNLPENPERLFASHPRSFESNRYVYPVLSRRAGGISIGVNLNLDQACNFKCIYCQVQRVECPRAEPIDLDRLAGELRDSVELVTSGRIFQGSKFSQTPQALRRLNDIAFSGDGEPTIAPQFEQAVSVAADVRRQFAPADVKLVLITNASTLHLDKVQQTLEVLDAAGGEIWAKLDAGTEPYFRRVAQTRVPYQRVLENLQEAARLRPIVIQSLFMLIDNQPPSAEEVAAYCTRLRKILDSGGHVKLVQVHTVARKPAESNVLALSNAQVDAITEVVRRETGLSVDSFYA